MDDSDFLRALGGEAVPFEVRGVPFLARPLTVSDAEAYRQYRDANPDDKAGHVAKLIALAVTRGDGGVIPFDLAAKLPANVADEFARKVATVNGWDDSPGKS